MKLNTPLFFLFFGAIIFASCDDYKGKDIPDVSNISSDLVIKRFERDLLNIDTSNMNSSLSKLVEKYPAFSGIFLNQLLGANDLRVAPQGAEEYIKGFVNFPPVRHLYDTTQVVFGEMTDIKGEFDQAFQFFQYHFPNRTVPDLTTFVSEYGVAAFIYGENSLAVGLDFFLGETYPYAYYNPANPNFSAYLTRTFNKDHLVRKTLTPMIEDSDFLGNPSGTRLLDLMIHNGKKLHVLSQLLPYAQDSVIVEYSQSQIDWVVDNEFQMWNHLLKEDLLYSTDMGKMRKLVEYSPHSPGMPPEAPGRTANWIGWQIVNAFMKRNPETSLEDLLKIRDVQVILDKSKYKPKG
ncbi:MAG: hypothetical protein ACI9XO_001917 [Paraglaciecola sp.]|jgi:hypothetical protein